MSSSAPSPQLDCATRHRENKDSRPHQLESLLFHELTSCLVPSGSAEHQALQQQALHQAALHHHSLEHHNDLQTQHELSTTGTQHPFHHLPHYDAHNQVTRVERMDADRPSACPVPYSDAVNICAEDEEDKARVSRELHTLSGTVDFHKSCHRLLALQHTDIADCKKAGKPMIISPCDEVPHNTPHSSLIVEDPLKKIEGYKESNLTKDGSIGRRDWPKVGNLRAKYRGGEALSIDGEVDLGAFTSKEESARCFQAGLNHVAHKMPKNAHAQFFVGLMCQRLEQPAKAASAFQKADEILKKSEEEFGQSRAQLLSAVQCHKAMVMLQATVVGNVHLNSFLGSSDAEDWVKDLKLAIQTDPCYALVWNTLGLVFFQIGQMKIAIYIFRSLLYAVPNCLDAFSNLGVAYLHGGHLANATRCFQSLLKKDSAYPGALLNYATLLLHQYGSSFGGPTGDGALGEVAAGTAQKCLIAALYLSPRAGHLWASLAAAYCLVCDLTSAMQCLDQAYKLEPTQLSIRYAVAMQRVHKSQNGLADSEALSWAAKEMLSILRVGDSATIQAHVFWAGLAKILRLQQEIGPALEGDKMYSRETKAGVYHTLQQAVEANPRDPVQWQQLGLYALCKLQFRIAQSFFKMAIAQRQTCGAIWSNLGISLQLSEEFCLAEEVYQKALSLVPQDKAHIILANLGNLYRQQRRFTDAHAAFQKALQICPNYAPACNNLGLLLVMEGKLEEAIKMFDCALQSDARLDAAKSNKMKAQALAQAREKRAVR